MRPALTLSLALLCAVPRHASAAPPDAKTSFIDRCQAEFASSPFVTKAEVSEHCLQGKKGKETLQALIASRGAARGTGSSSLGPQVSAEEQKRRQERSKAAGLKAQKMAQLLMPGEQPLGLEGNMPAGYYPQPYDQNRSQTELARKYPVSKAVPGFWESVRSDFHEGNKQLAKNDQAMAKKLQDEADALPKTGLAGWKKFGLEAYAMTFTLDGAIAGKVAEWTNGKPSAPKPMDDDDRFIAATSGKYGPGGAMYATTVVGAKKTAYFLKDMAVGTKDSFVEAYHSWGHCAEQNTAYDCLTAGAKSIMPAVDVVTTVIPIGKAVAIPLKAGMQTAKMGGRQLVKEGVETLVTQGVKKEVAAGSVEALGRTEWRAANRAVIEENLALTGRAERAAAIRAQMPALEESQVSAVLKAHEKFPCAGVGCTQAQLRGKYELLADAGLSPDQIRETLDRGLAGSFFKDLLAPANKVLGAGTGALEGVTLTVNGERLAAQLRRSAVTAAVPLKDVRHAGMLLYPSQNIASARIVAEYAELMKAGKWDWARGARIQIGTGAGGEAVIVEGHHRVLAAQVAGIKIPASAFAKTTKTATAFDWKTMAWRTAN